MRRWPLVLILVGLLLAAGWFALDALGLAFRGMLMLTSADPGVIGMTASDSDKPVEIALGTTFEHWSVRDADGRPTATKTINRDRRIVLRLPASYVTRIGKAREDKYPWVLGFTVWSGSFQPYMPDLIRSQEDRRKRGIERNAPSRPDDLLQQRMRDTGETAREFELTSNYRSYEEQRQGSLRLTGAKTAEKKPCERTYDETLGMLRVTVPAGVSHYDSCLSGQGTNGVNYLRQDREGPAKYAVTCNASGINRDGSVNQPKRCRLFGYYRNWSLFIWVQHSELAQLDALFERVTRFLDGYVVGET